MRSALFKSILNAEAADAAITTHAHPPGVFEDRYGDGARDRLLALLAQPCVTFSDIAAQFGVTRERVRQWHRELMPDAPRGHARRRLCWAHRQKRALLRDPLVRSFYLNARVELDAKRLRFLATREGFRKRVAEIDHGRVLIKDAHRLRRGGASTAYALNARGKASWIYYRLNDTDFLFVPRRALPAYGTTFIDGEQSKYQRFRNSFEPGLADVQAGAVR